jgi:hypothetical protein
MASRPSLSAAAPLEILPLPCLIRFANSNISKHVQPVFLIFILQLIVELSVISGRGRGDMPKFQCCVVVSSVHESNFALSHVGAGSDYVRSPGVFGSHAAFPSQSFTSLTGW